jgi:hypothetical protein
LRPNQLVDLVEIIWKSIWAERLYSCRSICVLTRQYKAPYGIPNEYDMYDGFSFLVRHDWSCVTWIGGWIDCCQDGQ